MRWTPATGPLGELTAASRERAVAGRATVARLERSLAAVAARPSLRAALRGPCVAVIAEIKRRSPSKGVLDDAISAPRRAADYVTGGARALSVLTEPSRFGGSLEDLRAAHAAVDMPLLRKDFITDRVQLLEAAVAGASAVLLIARALPPREFVALAREAQAIGLEPLLEVRTEDELALALGIPDAVIGVNNRNLETLTIDPTVGARIIPQIPPERIAVYESGVRDADDVRRAADAGADAVLVGSALSTAIDPVAAVAALAHVSRHARR